VKRAPVDVVIPFAGSDSDFGELLARLSRIELEEHDQMIVADNRPSSGSSPSTGRLRVVRAGEIRSSYYARNRGAAAGEASWLVFLDADVEWDARLLHAYFDPEPRERTGVLAGEIVDAPLSTGRRATLAERYAVSRATMATANTVEADEHPPYAQTANCAVRRDAFRAIGGFIENIRSGGDADLCFRLQAAGWELERRQQAVAVHRNRRRLGSLLMQKARHGSGAAWLERRHPGTFPRRHLSGLAWWSLRQAAGSLAPSGADANRSRATTLVDVAAVWAFELGRLRPNEVSTTDE